jgi:hypothetical protein
MSDERERRIGENEVVFRAVNERIEGLNEAFGMVTETMSVVCECGDIACSQQIEISLPEYERVRAEPTLFVVVPGHEIEDVEDVAERRDSYTVVRKHPGEPAKVAAENDPRA